MVTHHQGHRARRHGPSFEVDQLGEPAVAFLPGLDPDRLTGAQRHGGGKLGVLRLAPKLVDQVLVVAHRAGDHEAAGVGGQQNPASGGTEGGHALLEHGGGDRLMGTPPWTDAAESS